MNSRNAIQQELTDLRSSLPLSDVEQPVFTVPKGYFENFAASMLAKVNGQPSVTDELQNLSPRLAAIPRITPFSVPENYFSHLATDIPAWVNNEALPEILNTHTKQMPYTVPSSYFDGLATQVIAKLARPQAKVISLPQRFLRYAAAAAVAALMVLGGIRYFTSPGNVKTVDPTTHSAAWIAQNLKDVPNRELEAFLKTTDNIYASRQPKAVGGAEVRSLLRDVPTSDLDAFLKGLPPESELNNIN